jgi:hypothetical protein
MRTRGLVGVRQYEANRITFPASDGPPAGDPLDRNFSASSRNRVKLQVTWGASPDGCANAHSDERSNPTSAREFHSQFILDAWCCARRGV